MALHCLGCPTCQAKEGHSSEGRTGLHLSSPTLGALIRHSQWAAGTSPLVVGSPWAQPPDN